MAKQEAKYSLEIVVHATTCTSTFGLPALIRAAFSLYRYWKCTRLVSYYSVSVIKDVRWWATYRELSALA